MNNLFRGNSFNIILRNDVAKMEWFASSIDLPEISIGKVLPAHRGIRLNRSGDSIEWGDITVNVNLSDDLKEYVELINYITQLKTDNFRLSNYPFSASIIINNNKNVKILEILLYDVVINSINGSQLTTKDNEVKEMPVVLSYSNMKLK